MRVLLLNQTFYPDVAATAQHAHDLGKYLVSQGHQVAIVASRSLYGHRGAVLPRYEVVDGIEVHRVGMSLFGKASLRLRLLDFLFFYFWATIKAFTIRRPDVTVPFTTPPFISLLAWMLKAVKGCPYVYWVMDLYPDVLIECGVLKRQGIAARIFEAVGKFCLRHASRVVVLGRCMKQRVADKGIPADRLANICVWSDADEIRPLPLGAGSYRDEWGLRDQFVVMYSGNFGIGHDVNTMCHAALKLRDHPRVRFAFVGGGKRLAQVREFAENHRLDNVLIRDYQPRARLGDLLALGDVHLITLAERSVGVMIPSKFYGVLAAARPSIFVGSPRSEVAQVLSETDTGFVVPPGDADGLVRVIETLAADPSLSQQIAARARQTLESRYTRRLACEQWERVLLEAVGGLQPAPAPRDPAATRPNPAA